MRPPSDARRLFVTVLGAIWVITFAYAFVAFATTPAMDSGLTRGLNRVTAFLGWQAVAGMVGIAIFALGLRWPRRSPIRRFTKVPVVIALAQSTGLVALVVWAALAEE